MRYVDSWFTLVFQNKKYQNIVIPQASANPNILASNVKINAGGRFANRNRNTDIRGWSHSTISKADRPTSRVSAPSSIDKFGSGPTSSANQPQVKSRENVVQPVSRSSLVCLAFIGVTRAAGFTSHHIQRNYKKNDVIQIATVKLMSREFYKWRTSVFARVQPAIYVLLLFLKPAVFSFNLFWRCFHSLFKLIPVTHSSFTFIAHDVPLTIALEWARDKKVVCL